MIDHAELALREVVHALRPWVDGVRGREASLLVAAGEQFELVDHLRPVDISRRRAPVGAVEHVLRHVRQRIGGRATPDLVVRVGELARDVDELVRGHRGPRRRVGDPGRIEHVLVVEHLHRAGERTQAVQVVLPGAAQVVARFDDRRHIRRDVDPFLRHHVVDRQDQSRTDLVGTGVQGQIRFLARGDRGVELDPVVLLGIGGDVEVDVRVGGLEFRLQRFEESFLVEGPELDRDLVAGGTAAGVPASPSSVGFGTARATCRDER